jgi:hypothetical protein
MGRHAMGTGSAAAHFATAVLGVGAGRLFNGGRSDRGGSRVRDLLLCPRREAWLHYLSALRLPQVPGGCVRELFI